MDKTGFLFGWQHESFRLIRGQKPVYGQTHMKMACCRNDFAAASLVLQSDERFVLQLEDHAEFYARQWNDFRGEYLVLRPEVDCPGLPDLTLSRVQMHPDDDQVGKGDALFDWGSELVEPRVPLQLFLRLNAAPDTAPGRYPGTVRLYAHRQFEDEELALVLTFEAEVADVVLPSGPEQTFHLVIWQHPANIARHHQVPLFSDAHFALLEDYTRTLREMGNVAATVTVSDIPWVGQDCFARTNPYSDLFEYNMVRIFREKDGSFRYDFSVLQRYLELCRKYGMTREIHLFGLAHNWVRPECGYGNITDDYPDPIRLRYTDRADGCARYMRKAADIKAYIAALYRWLDEEGWLPGCLVAPDEPEDMEALTASMSALKEAAPDFRIQADYSPFFIMDHPELEITSYAPLIPTIAEGEKKEPGIIRKVMDRCSGSRLWYTCCWPATPNTFLGSPLLEGRLIPLVTQWLGLDGFLRWAYTCWPADPLRNGKAMGWPVGDAFFVYPGRGGQPILSLRYFALKRGIGDFELMQMVKRECPDGEALVQSALRQIIRQPDITRWSWDAPDENQCSYDPADYEAVRAQMVKALLDARSAGMKEGKEKLHGK
ncbi:MAG: DUF4091 domain-containing protein [Oscillospiraceae bacterium]|nr:DUF4091 domain-containing protein [Oscillospiraceae bacterium]